MEKEVKFSPSYSNCALPSRIIPFIELLISCQTSFKLWMAIFFVLSGISVYNGKYIIICSCLNPQAALLKQWVPTSLETLFHYSV